MKKMKKKMKIDISLIQLQFFDSRFQIPNSNWILIPNSKCIENELKLRQIFIAAIATDRKIATINKITNCDCLQLRLFACKFQLKNCDDK